MPRYRDEFGTSVRIEALTPLRHRRVNRYPGICNGINHHRHVIVPVCNIACVIFCRYFGMDIRIQKQIQGRYLCAENTLAVVIFHLRIVDLMIDGQLNGIADFDIASHRTRNRRLRLQGFVVVNHPTTATGEDRINMYNRINLVVNDHGTVRICRRVITCRIGSGDGCSNMRIVLQPLGVHINGIPQGSQIWQVHHGGINRMATNIQVHHIIHLSIAPDRTADDRRGLP